MTIKITFIFVVLMLLLSNNALSMASGGQELFMCKNVQFKEGTVDRKILNEFKRRASMNFRPGDRICVFFSFCPEHEKTVEFIWIDPFGHEHSRSRHVLSYYRGGLEYYSYSWMVLNASFFDKIIGSRFAGQWSVKIFIDNAEAARQFFSVSRD